MNLFSLFQRNSTKPIIVADIEGGSVGIAIVHLNKRGPASVILTARAALSLEERTPSQAVAEIAQTIPALAGQVLGAYAKKHLPQPERGYVIIRSPWVRTFGARVESDLGAEMPVRADMVERLAKSALQQMDGLDQRRLLEASAIYVYLNGYPTKKPVKKRAKSITVVALASDIDTDVRATIRHALGVAFPGRTFKERSGSRALITLIGDKALSTRDYLVMDVGHDGTNIITIRKNEITTHVYTPEGLRSILRRITPSGGLPEERLALLRMAASDACTEEACNELYAALGKAEGELSKVFGEAFAKLAEKRRIPNALVLSTPPALAPWFENFLTRVDFGQFTITTTPFSVRTLTPKALASYVVFDQGAIGDTGLATAVAFVNIQEQST